MFDKQADAVYYTGKRFPTTVDLKNLKYFMPYIKGKGVRDLYSVKAIYVSEYKNGKNDAVEYRLTFDLSFIGQIDKTYNKIKLGIWHTYSQTELGSICRRMPVVSRKSGG